MDRRSKTLGTHYRDLMAYMENQPDSPVRGAQVIITSCHTLRNRWERRKLKEKQQEVDTQDDDAEDDNAEEEDADDEDGTGRLAGWFSSPPPTYNFPTLLIKPMREKSLQISLQKRINAVEVKHETFRQPIKSSWRDMGDYYGECPERKDKESDDNRASTRESN